MLFISISPKCSARITVPWTALIYVPAPHPIPHLTGSCRDAVIEWELETDFGRQAMCFDMFIYTPPFFVCLTPPPQQIFYTKGDPLFGLQIPFTRVDCVQLSLKMAEKKDVFNVN